MICWTALHDLYSYIPEAFTIWVVYDVWCYLIVHYGIISELRKKKEVEKKRSKKASEKKIWIKNQRKKERMEKRASEKINEKKKFK